MLGPRAAHALHAPMRPTWTTANMTCNVLLFEPSRGKKMSHGCMEIQMRQARRRAESESARVHTPSLTRLEHVTQPTCRCAAM
jgi:hypothetical protein